MKAVCLSILNLASAFNGSSSLTIEAFQFQSSSRRSFPPLGVSPTPTQTLSRVAASADPKETIQSNDAESWATHALLFSSLSDGVIPNNGARSFLRYSLANSLLREHIARKEDRLKSSVEFSPCNGPDMDAFNHLETFDQLYERGQKFSSNDFDFEANEQIDSWAKETLGYLRSDANNHDFNVRVLYIPTAMYALNPKSSNTPGKQRQRARADGKKRRTQLLKLLDELLSPDNDSDGPSQFNLIATTLDLDDGSLKQPVGSDDKLLFPENDRAALSTWHPHLIYVEGGNTFWLQHCMDKGEYSALMRDACTGPYGAVYCGKSAGAIVAGSAVATATWKGWDDPSVVPGKESYDDWLNHRGLEFVGDRSFFPHMSDDWKDTVEEKGGAQNLGESVYCLREEDACCVIGDKKLSFVTSGASPVN